MRQVLKSLLTISLLLSTAAVRSDDVLKSTFAMPLTQQATALHLANMHEKTHRHDADATYGVIKGQLEYQHSFNGGDFAKKWLGKDVMTIGAGNSSDSATSLTPDGADIMAPYLLLADDFIGSVKMNPKIWSMTGNMNLFVGFNEWVEGLYLTATLPVVKTEADLRLSSTVTTAGSSTYSEGDFSTTAGGDNVVYADGVAAFKGDKIVGDIKQAWKYGRVDGKQEDTRIGQVQIALGYNFINREDCHLGAEVHGLFSGGKNSEAAYLFEPMVANGGRMGLGAGVHGHYDIWKNDEDHCICANLRANVSHLFESEMRRTYAYTASGAGSQYLLAKKFDSAAKYDGEVVSSVNLTSLRAKIDVDVVYDAQLMFSYHNGALALSLGGNLQGQSKENHRKWVDSIEKSKWALYEYDQAYVWDGTNNLNTAAASVRIDGSLAANNSGDMTVDDVRFISNDSLNIESGLAKDMLAVGLVGHAGWTFDSEWMPSVGLGAKTDFGVDNKTLSNWGVFADMGICF